jgi:hypothetical protein
MHLELVQARRGAAQLKLIYNGQKRGLLLLHEST